MISLALVLFRIRLGIRKLAEQGGELVGDRLVKHLLIGASETGPKRFPPGTLLYLVSGFRRFATFIRLSLLILLVRHFFTAPLDFNTFAAGQTLKARKIFLQVMKLFCFLRVPLAEDFFANLVRTLKSRNPACTGYD